MTPPLPTGRLVSIGDAWRAFEQEMKLEYAQDGGVAVIGVSQRGYAGYATVCRSIAHAGPAQQGRRQELVGKSWPGGQASPKRTVNRFVTFRFGQLEPTSITRPCFRPGPPCLLELFALTGKVQPDQPASLALATVPGSWLARLEAQHQIHDFT